MKKNPNAKKRDVAVKNRIQGIVNSVTLLPYQMSPLTVNYTLFLCWEQLQSVAFFHQLIISASSVRGTSEFLPLRPLPSCRERCSLCQKELLAYSP